MRKQILFSLITASALTIASCRSKAVRHEEAPPAPVEAAPAPTPVPAPAPAVQAEPSTTEAAAAVAPAPAHAEEAKGVPAEQALSWLKNGNKRFMKGHLRGDGQKRSDIIRLAKGQMPHTIVLSCSDSRVPPEIVFDQKLGEIFVVRTAGEALDHNVIGSIEYAVEHLNSHHLLVMGHTQCGAIKAALATINGGDAGSPSLNHLVKDLHPRLPATPATADVAVESFANARGVAADLVQRSALLRQAVADGKLTIHTALYHLNTGAVDFE